MPLDPKARDMLVARAKVLPRTGTVSAQEMRELHRGLLTRLPPGPAIFSVTNLACPGQTRDIPLRLYRPSEKVKAFIVYFHGGGWTVGSLDGWDTALRKLAIATRCAVLSVDYRLAPEHQFPAAHDDALSAVRWAAANEADLVGSDVPLIVAGDSAGANLSTSVALILRDKGDPLLSAQLLLYPSTDGDIDSPFMHRFVPPSLTRDEIAWYYDQYVPDRTMRQDPRFAPLRASHFHGLPPTFIGTVENDLLREEAEMYAKRLRESGVPVVEKCYLGTFHGFFTADRGLLPHSGAAIEDMHRFIEDLL